MRILFIVLASIVLAGCSVDEGELNKTETDGVTNMPIDVSADTRYGSAIYGNSKYQERQ